MKYEMRDTESFEADFALGGEVEFEELDCDGCDGDEAELGELAERVRAARFCA